MAGLRCLYISKDEKVFKVSHPKNGRYKAIKELAGKNVLQVMLYYETKNRKPERLLIVEFDRIRLDNEGGYELTDEEVNKVMENAFQFMFVTPEQLASKEEPFVIPIAPSIPTVKEKNALYEYINQKIPLLAKGAPQIVENKIHALKNAHQEKIAVIKEAKLLRGGLL